MTASACLCTSRKFLLYGWSWLSWRRSGYCGGCCYFRWCCCRCCRCQWFFTAHPFALCAILFWKRNKEQFLIGIMTYNPLIQTYIDNKWDLSQRHLSCLCSMSLNWSYISSVWSINQFLFEHTYPYINPLMKQSNLFPRPCSTISSLLKH